MHLKRRDLFRGVVVVNS
jgi:hypothetical protein